MVPRSPAGIILRRAGTLPAHPVLEKGPGGSWIWPKSEKQAFVSSLPEDGHSSICLPKKAAATWVSFTSPSPGTAPLSGSIKQTAPVTSPEATMGTTTAA